MRARQIGETSLKLLVSGVRNGDAAAFRAARAAVGDAARLQDEAERQAILLGLLNDCSDDEGQEFLESFADPVWDERMKGFEHAWAWRRQTTGCSARSRRLGPLERPLTKRLKRHEDEVRAILNELAATRAWGHCLGSMTDTERMHLVAWSKAVRKIGKGTGKYAARHRREARENMDTAAPPSLPGSCRRIGWRRL